MVDSSAFATSEMTVWSLEMTHCPEPIYPIQPWGKNFSRPAKSRTHIPLFLLPGIPLRSMPGYFQNVPSGL
jgi:hypothetical protein